MRARAGSPSAAAKRERHYSWAAVAVPAQLARTRADRGGWVTLTVAVEKLLDAGLFRDDLVRRPCTLYELFLGRDLVEHVLRRRAINVRELRRWRDVRIPR